MNEIEAQSLMQSWENMAIMVRYIADYPQYIDLLMTKATDDSQPENWRAAWMIDKIHDKHPEIVEPYLPRITEFVLKTKNSGKKRHFLKLISLYPIPDEKLTELLDFGINTFTGINEDIAVRVHAMQILSNIAEREPGLASEFIELIEREMEYHGSAGLNSRGKKILKKLYKLKNQ